MIIEQSVSASTPSGNNLFPVFLKLEKLHVLIVGGGYVGAEKLRAVLQNSPAAKITIVARNFNSEVCALSDEHDNIQLLQKSYEATDINGADIIIAAVDDVNTSTQIANNAHAIGKLVNVADKPALCDFYLSSVVKKGNLKIAISTNGKSPTIAKRLKEVLNETLPPQLDDVLSNMEHIRHSLKGDFSAKVHQLNKITRTLAGRKNINTTSANKLQIHLGGLVTAIIFSMIIGHLLFAYTPLKLLWQSIAGFLH